MERGRLIITIPLEADKADNLTNEAMVWIGLLTRVALPESTTLTVLREGDRSGGNLLLPKLASGHLQGRKVSLTEMLERVACRDTFMF